MFCRQAPDKRSAFDSFWPGPSRVKFLAYLLACSSHEFVRIMAERPKYDDEPDSEPETHTHTQLRQHIAPKSSHVCYSF